jgi:hypothetical protein
MTCPRYKSTAIAERSDHMFLSALRRGPCVSATPVTAQSTTLPQTVTGYPSGAVYSIDEADGGSVNPAEWSASPASPSWREF